MFSTSELGQNIKKKYVFLNALLATIGQFINSDVNKMYLKRIRTQFCLLKNGAHRIFLKSNAFSPRFRVCMDRLCGATHRQFRMVDRDVSGDDVQAVLDAFACDDSPL